VKLLDEGAWAAATEAERDLLDLIALEAVLDVGDLESLLVSKTRFRPDRCDTAMSWMGGRFSWSIGSLCGALGSLCGALGSLCGAITAADSVDLRDEAVVKFPALIPVKVVFDTALEGA